MAERGERGGRAERAGAGRRGSSGRSPAAAGRGRRPVSGRNGSAGSASSRSGGAAARGRRPVRPNQARRGAAAFGLSTTRRAAVVAIVVCALALSVAVPLRTYLAQRSDVQITEQRVASLQRQVDELARRRAELADPAQVEADARRRLRFVMPGETPYLVELPGDRGGMGGGQPAGTPAPPGAWFQQLWGTVVAR